MLREDLIRNIQRCNKCPFLTKSGFFMVEHSRHHQNEVAPLQCDTSIEMYQCLYCDYNSEIIIAIKKHIKNFHQMESKSLEMKMHFTSKCYFCRSCEFQTYSILYWYKHTFNNCLKFANQTQRDSSFQILRKSQTKLFECGQCDYKSTKRYVLKQHIMHKHLEEDKIKWFKCEQCDYKAKRRYHLKEHTMCQHTKEEKITWFTCDKCGYKTKYKHNLQRHEQFTHWKEDAIKRFKCEHCSYKAKRKGDLKHHFICRHLEKDKIKWFKCEQCDFKTKWNNELKVHFISKHEIDVKWFECDQCEFITKLGKYLKTHVRNQHTNKDKIQSEDVTEQSGSWMV